MTARQSRGAGIIPCPECHGEGWIGPVDGEERCSECLGTGEVRGECAICAASDVPISEREDWTPGEYRCEPCWEDRDDVYADLERAIAAATQHATRDPHGVVQLADGRFEVILLEHVAMPARPALSPCSLCGEELERTDALLHEGRPAHTRCVMRRSLAARRTA